jgi:hypothetical protein
MYSDPIQYQNVSTFYYLIFLFLFFIFYYYVFLPFYLLVVIFLFKNAEIKTYNFHLSNELQSIQYQ